MPTPGEKAKGPPTPTMTRSTTHGDRETFEIMVKDSSNVDVVALRDDQISPDDKKLLRKIDLYLPPLLTLSEMLQFLDKQTLNFASFVGPIDDLDLKGTEYSCSGSIIVHRIPGIQLPSLNPDGSTATWKIS